MIQDIMQLDRDDMIEEFERNGWTAIPHPYYPGAIAMPLHHKVDAQHTADYYGWEWIPMGWAPKSKKFKQPPIRLPKGDKSSQS